jgi:hypothetical protein
VGSDRPRSATSTRHLARSIGAPRDDCQLKGDPLQTMQKLPRERQVPDGKRMRGADAILRALEAQNVEVMF